MGQDDLQTKCRFIIQNSVGLHNTRSRELQHVRSFWANSAFRWKYRSKWRSSRWIDFCL